MNDITKKQTERSKIYIYNPKQSIFYITKGAIPLSIGVNKNSNKAYVIFYRDEHLKYFDEWVTKKHD